MTSIVAFGAWLPPRVVPNSELAALLDCTPEWILEVSGIEERRYASPEEDVVAMAVAAAKDCLERARCAAADVRLLIVSSASAAQRFPGPAAAVAAQLGLGETPAMDVPVASAGSLFGLVLAAQLAASAGPVLVVAAEKMSGAIVLEPAQKATSILFGDGAGACLVREGPGLLRVVHWRLGSDGAFAADLRLPLSGPVEMNGRSVILQASRKIPRAITEVLARGGVDARDVEAFIMHQANQNLMDRVARAVGAAPERFYSNIRRYGNTSSASMLIAAAEWASVTPPRPGAPVCFAAFGAGFHWGALLAIAE
ncbi:MAG: 3-oxoacyl-[acyl-carrier-protein] synthase III C-terminal domain-containing protein [Bryobacteraceae bacterium]|jgi:3-oxoacyl-[acyl-carrier-protein] synthase-3